MTKQIYEQALVIGGVITTLIGAYLPWGKSNPNLPPDTKVPTMEFSGTYARFTIFDIPFIALVIIAIFCLVFLGRKAQVVATISAGTVLTLASLFYLSGSLIGFNSTIIPAIGWFMALLAGTLWLILGVRKAYSLKQHSEQNV